MIHAVLDTNTILSGMFWVGPPRLVYSAAQSHRFQALTTEPLIAELVRVLNYEKFTRVLAGKGISSDDAMSVYREIVEFVNPSDVPANAARDSKDIAVLACAVGGRADYIVSGDNDLLILNTYQNIPIVNAVQFLEGLARGGE